MSEQALQNEADHWRNLYLIEQAHRRAAEDALEQIIEQVGCCRRPELPANEDWENYNARETSEEGEAAQA